MADLGKELEPKSANIKSSPRHSKLPAGDNTLKCYHNNVCFRYFCCIVKRIFKVEAMIIFHLVHLKDENLSSTISPIYHCLAVFSH